MPRPAVHPFAEGVADRVSPLLAGDESQDWPFLRFLDAIGVMFDPHIVYQDGASFLDPSQVPVEALGWVAQWHGVKLIPGLTEAAQRDWVRDGSRLRRGTQDVFVSAVQSTLTGNKRVDVYTGTGPPGDEAYGMVIVTYTSETPDPPLTLSAIGAASPAGLIVTHDVRTGQSYAEVDAAYSTYQQIIDASITYQQLKDG